MVKEYKTKKYVKYIEIHVTCPNMEIAERIANSLVNDKYVACAQILDTWKSVYLWNWKIEKQNEILLLLKTRWRYFKKIEKTIKELHPYTTPEIIAIPIIKANDEYVKWIDESLWLKIIDFEKDKVIEKK